MGADRGDPGAGARDFPRLDQIRADGLFVAAARSRPSSSACFPRSFLPSGAPAPTLPPLRGGARSVGTPGRRLRRVLIGHEAAFAVVLLVGACLLARSFVTLFAWIPGTTLPASLTADVRLPDDETAGVHARTWRWRSSSDCVRRQASERLARETWHRSAACCPASASGCPASRMRMASPWSRRRCARSSRPGTPRRWACV